MTKIRAFGANSPEEQLKPLLITRREIGSTDVEIAIQFCGVCHSDLHTVRDEWGGTIYPSVPGHEIVGIVTHVGKEVKKFNVNDQVGVGCLVDSCRTCESCKDGLEQYCEKGAIQTYNAHEKQLDQQTFGGYSERIVVDQDFVLSIPKNLDLAATAPLLCAGITTYSPLRHWKVGKGTKVGVVGIGGLGHMGVKIAKAMGAHVVVITTSPSKVEDAKRLGADEIILSSDKAQMKKNANSLDFILDCVSAQHDINVYLRLLKRDGSLTLVGAPDKPLPVSPFSLIPGRKSFAGSMIGGIQETQEMLDFCGKHNIVSDIELIDMQTINEAYDRLLKGDVKYRFVIDMSTLA
ncbi:NAD(P)-dependent alcohol dehydrogenase [Belliella sp. DSM 111904]|uniref:NAD(P)-dependent alcohol dehydrogenase n=1 Tax=Belliella filtrata TaxID=2923435 RepID=A0ABS9UWQ7_9BACT|nr:NAD(P)-dependent alcohol dehydrogenase [Belliella filtrata]MCH7408190.1 NAD(P)-dependent alcohol dehydrogenase [Belliella filtrata]